MGVRRQYQGTMLGAALAVMAIAPIVENLRKKGVVEVDMSWILEQNKGMRKIIELLGGEPYTRYRIYQKDLTAG